MLLTRLISVIPEDRARKTRVDLLDSLGALREQLDLPRSIFGLWSDGEVLRDEHRSLVQLGVGSGSRLVAAPKTRAVSLRQREEEPVSMGFIRRDVTFGTFLKMASKALKVELSPETRFVCDCGRVVSAESAERRRLPRRCCEKEELQLTVQHPLRGESRCDVYVPTSTEATVVFNSSRKQCSQRRLDDHSPPICLADC